MTQIDHTSTENPNSPKLIPAIIYGSVISLLTFMIMITATWTGWDMNSGSYKAAIWILTAAILFLCIKDYRDLRNNKKLTVGQGAGLGALIGLVSGILGAILFYFFITYINPGFLAEIENVAIEEMQSKGLSDEQIEQSLQMMSFFMNPVFMGVMTLIFSVIFNLIAGLIIGAILKRD
ncbi:MAG: DUF4199 domain-containing protein [Flavobacteriales bacterium]|nr:DUF4199 domain-containing protein [Flavobacteriales bacterium]